MRRPEPPKEKMQRIAEAEAFVANTRADIRHGNFLAVWNEPHDLRHAWAEITGQTQNEESRLFTIYIGPDGKIRAVK